MSNWVEEFNSFAQRSPGQHQHHQHQVGNSNSNSSGRPRGGISITQAKQLHIAEEIKLTQWHKVADTIDLRNPKANPHLDDETWMKQVADLGNTQRGNNNNINNNDNNNVSEGMANGEKVMNAEKLAKQVEGHIHILKTLRDKLENKHDGKQTRDEFLTWKKDKMNSNHQGNKFIERTTEVIETVGNDFNNGNEDDQEMARYVEICRDFSLKKGAGSELSNILTSLNKLSDLEKRISSMENDNVGQLVGNSQGPRQGQGQRSIPNSNANNANLRKGQNAPARGAVGRNLPPLASKGGARNNNVNINRNNQFRSVNQINNRFQGGNNRGQEGVFLTEFENGGDGRDDPEDPATEEEEQPTDFQSQRANMARMRATASMGQKNMQDRMNARRNKLKNDALAKQNHAKALEEMNRRRQQGPPKRKGPPPTRIAKGAAAGVKTTNRHLADFQSMKNNFSKKKEVFGAPVQQVRELPKRNSNGSSNNNNNLRKPSNFNRGSNSPRNQPQQQQGWQPNMNNRQANPIMEQPSKNIGLTRRTSKPMPNPARPLPAVDHNANQQGGQDFGLFGQGANVGQRNMKSKW